MRIYELGLQFCKEVFYGHHRKMEHCGSTGL